MNYERSSRGPVSTGNQSDLADRGTHSPHSPYKEEVQGASDATTEAGIIKRKLTGFAADPPPRFIPQANQVLQHASPDAKKLLWEDQAFWAIPFFKTNPRAADQLLRKLDPVDTLRLTVAYGNAHHGWADEQVLGEVQAWSKANAGSCERALTSGALLDQLQVSLLAQTALPKAIEILMHKGDVPSGALARLRRALDDKSEQAFIAAWDEATRDAAVLTDLASDAAFLNDVEAAFSATVFAIVERTLIANASSLDQDDAGKLEGVIADACKNLDEVNDYWVDDATVMGALRQMNERVAQVFPGSPAEIEGRKHFVRNAVIQRMDAYVKGEYPQQHFMERLKRGLSAGNYKEAESLLQIPAGFSTTSGKTADEAFAADAEPVAREQAGRLQTEFDDWIVHDSNVERLFADAEAAMHKVALKHANKIADALGLARKGMVMVKNAYDQQFGSLVDAVHRRVQTDGIREHCLNLISAKNDGTNAIVDKAVGGLAEGKDDDAKQGQMKALSAIQAQVRTLAEELDKACHNRSYSGAQDVATRLQSLKAGKVEGTTTSKDTQMIPASEVMKMFTLAFAAAGGSLQHRIVESFTDTESAQKLLDALEVGANASRLAAGGAAAGLTDEEVGVRGDAIYTAGRVFTRIEKNKRNSQISRVKSAVKDFIETEKAYKTALGNAAKDIYKEQNGIGLVHHLGLKIFSRRDREELAEIVGQPIEARLDTSYDEAREKDVDIAFDPFAVGSTFDMEEARKRALSIKDDIDNNKNTIFQLSKDGNKEELRVVIAVFEDIYGYNPLFAIKEAQQDGKLNSKEVDASIERLKDAGQASFGQRLIEMARSGDTNAVYDVAYKAKAADKQALLADGQKLAELRRALKPDQWERVWESLHGDLQMSEALRTREGWLWGWGSDDEGMKSDITMIGTEEKKADTSAVDATHKKTEDGLTAKSKQTGLSKTELSTIQAELKKLKKKKAEEVDARFAMRMRRLWADPEVRAILERELSGEALLTMQQLILRGGTQTGTDKIWAEAESWGNSASILTSIKEMTDEEREAKRKDPRFVAMLTRQLQGAKLSEALALLLSKKGEENATGIDKALASAGVDEQGLFASIGAMSTAELIALSQDDRKITSIRARLRNQDDLKRFDDLIEEVKTQLGPKDLAPAKNKDGEQTADWTDAARKQERARLVLKHSLAIKDGVARGKDELLAALQAVYTEKGEITPSKADPSKKEELFTATARKDVLLAAGGAVSNYYGVGSELHSLAVQAIEKKSDPSEARLEYALHAYWDNMDNAKAALSGVSEKELVEDWSNIVNEGEDGRSLKAQYEAYDKERQAQKGKTPTPEDEHKLEALRYRYVDFPLDVSKDLVDILARRSSDAWIGEYMTERALLEMKQLVRTKLVALPSTAVAKAIGVQGVDDLDKIQDEKKKAALQAEIDTAQGTDRQARSMHAHIKDLGRHQMTADSLADGFTYTDEQMAMYYSHYAGAYGEATEHKAGEKGEFGTIDKTEKEELDARLARFKTSVDEYKKAKSKVAEVMKWIAIAAIAAVSAAFTGPAGPTLLVTLLTAGASATASVIIDEAVQGNDYDAGTEGVQKIVTDVGVAALTFGLSKGWDHAVKNYKFAGGIDTAIKAVTEKEKQIAEAMKAAGFGPHAAWNMGKAALKVPLDEVKGAAVASLDLSELKYGWRQGMTHADNTFRTALDGMDQKTRDAMLKALIDTGFEHLKDRLFPEEKDKKGVPGAEDEDPVPKVRSDDKVLEDAYGETLSWGKLKEAAFDQTAEVATGHLITLSNGKTVNLSSADGLSFLETYIKGRIGGFVKQIGTEIGKERSNRIIAAKAAELADDSGFQGLPADEQLAALKLYVHVLKAEGAFGRIEKGKEGGFQMGEFGQSPAAFMAGRWAEVDKAIQERVPSGGLATTNSESEAHFREWVLSDPGKIDERLKTDFLLFSVRLSRAKKQAEKLNDPEVIKLLKTQEERDFFAAYVSDPKRLMDFSNGEIDTSLDITTEDGRKAFGEAVLVSKLSIAGNLMPQVTGGTEEQRQDFSEKFKSTEHVRVSFDPADEAGNLKQLQMLFDVEIKGVGAQDDEIKAFQQSVLPSQTGLS